MADMNQIRDWFMVERERRRRRKRAQEAPRYDWYGPDCGCPIDDRKEDGSCPEHPRARPKQRPPEGRDWLYWIILSGRGFGKTLTGARWIIHRAMTGPPNGRYALIGKNSEDVREVMIKGESGILNKCPPWFRPRHNKTHGTLEWPNGSMAFSFSSEEPDSLRGPQFHDAWCDEFAKFSYIEECWANLELANRLGKDQGHIPRVVITTTPLPIPLLTRLCADPKARVVSGSTFENKANLADSYVENVRRRFDGTRLGQQELYGIILSDIPGSLWKAETIDRYRVERAPELYRLVVAVDPSGNNPSLNTYDEDKVAEAGIVLGGIAEDGHKYILKDLSLSASPAAWAQVAVDAYHEHMADTIAAEVNFGAAMVEAVVRSIDDSVSFTGLRASRGKYPRAEPVAAEYERGMVHHVGHFPKLEAQMVSWVQGMKSPDRMDAVVWLVTELGEGAPAFYGPDPLEDFRGD